MKKYLFLVGILLLIGCSNDSDSSNNEGDGAKNEEPNQEKLDNELKDEAREVNFTRVRAGRVEEGTKVLIQGEVTMASPIEVGSELVVATQEDGGHGMYTVQNMDSDSQYEEGDFVKVYGTYNGKSEGTPKITSPLIEVQ
ncbi:hypothetical protein SAMN05216353_11126 [Halobacillus alkaliphilus]|uniref:Lipoprotein n=1 Tax=Halobacillus alkaliphilus TaxID=396056 RepID=A0A1I2M4I2_9BACI|nr:hypothetical protein [Halobacillus alkaliphilus]SFF85689.1 hypothetical protein SAMN05216353_11126 [Halobacillus alkaliphilus]